MDNNKKNSKVYVVQVGSFDEGPEDVYVKGVFKKLKDALKLRNELYMDGVLEELDEDEKEDLRYELESMEIDNGHEFFNIIEMDLQ